MTDIQRLYVAVCNDRHIDPVVMVFTDRARAIEAASIYMREHVACPEKLQKNDSGGRWSISYEFAEDNAFVVSANIGEIIE